MHPICPVTFLFHINKIEAFILLFHIALSCLSSLQLLDIPGSLGVIGLLQSRHRWYTPYNTQKGNRTEHRGIRESATQC